MKKLIERRAALKALLDSMLAQAKTEERAFTDEEVTKFNDAEKEIKAIDATIGAEERAKLITEHIENNLSHENPTTEEQEERAFCEYLLGRTTEMRADGQNISLGNNGAIIPETIANRIIEQVTELCPILAGADVYHERGKLQIPKWTIKDGDITAGYSDDFTELTANSGAFASVDLEGYLVGALVLIGRRTVNNAKFNVVDFIIRKISEKVSSFVEGELLTGTGTDAVQGALNTANTVTAAASTAITLDELIRLQAAVKTVYQKNACWTMHSDTFTAIKLLKDGDEKPLIQTDVTKEFPHTLLGKPVYLSENMPKIETGKKPILYGDYSGLSVNMRENISIEVLREKYATQHALGVIAWLEFDSKVTDEQKLAALVMA
ncbi:MAG: phage major capsid protein [Ruminococcus sp.]|nr:phage major capsid protein [Ruminococcus sp.]